MYIRTLSTFVETWDKSTSTALRSTTSNMLEALDFIAERGGDPKKVRESQRLRFAPEALVDEVIELWQDARKGQYRGKGFEDLLTSHQHDTKQLRWVQRSMLSKKRSANCAKLVGNLSYYRVAWS